MFPKFKEQAISDIRAATNDEKKVSLLTTFLAKEFKEVVGNKLHYCSFKFMESGANKTSHLIIHFCKHPKGFKLIKQVYYDYDNIGAILGADGAFTFDAKMAYPTVLDFSTDENHIKLAEELAVKFSGRKLNVEQLMDEHHPSPYAPTHYVKALRKLVDENKLTAEFNDNVEHRVTVLPSKNCILKFPSDGKIIIEWTGMTWNPTTGCDKLTAGCKFCYAEEMTRRLQAMGQEKYSEGFKFRMHESAIEIPYSWKKPQVVFVNSLSDLFHKDVTLEFVQKVFAVMNDTPQHTYQILTKRGDVLEKFAPFLDFSSNIWMGVSVEDNRVISRINSLRKINAHVRFLSLEPLLGPLPKLDLSGIHWVIVGGESGRSARSIEEKWVEEIRLQCEDADVNFFFKQWGGKNKKAAGRILNHRTYDDMPAQSVIS